MRRLRRRITWGLFRCETALEAFDWGSVTVEASLPLEELLRSIEAQIASASVEVALVLDVSGKVLVKQAGDVNRIGFTARQEARMKNGYFTHNHPSGAFFSVRDILFAHDNDLTEMRVVTGEYVHRLIRPATGWDAVRAHQAARLERQRAERQLRKDLNLAKYLRRMQAAPAFLIVTLALLTQTENR